MGYLSPDEFGKKQNPPISGKRVRVLIAAGRITKAERMGERKNSPWIIPEDAKIMNRQLSKRPKS